MKNKLNSNNLINTYYDNGLYELEFYVDGKKIFIRNIREEDYQDAKNDEWYFDDDEIIKEIIENANDEDIEGLMLYLEGKKVKDLSKEEREYLEATISGDYRGSNGKLEIGRNEVTIDFENGLSVLGWIVNTEDEMVYELNEDAVIYNPSN